MYEEKENRNTDSLYCTAFHTERCCTLNLTTMEREIMEKSSSEDSSIHRSPSLDSKDSDLLNLLPQQSNLVEVLLLELSMVQLDHADRTTLASKPGLVLGLGLA